MAEPPEIRVPRLSLTAAQWRRILVVAALIVVLWVLWIARGALFPFLLGVIIAFVIAPAVERIARLQPWHRANPVLSRGVAILAVYFGVLAAIGVPAFFLVPALVDESIEFVDEAPALFEDAQRRLEDLTSEYERRVPEDVRERIDEAVADLGQRFGDIAAGVAARTASTAFSNVAALIGYVAVPFFVFYAVRDRDQARHWFYNLFPERIRPDVEECTSIVNRVFGAYLRGQLILGFAIFVITLAGLWLMDIQFAIALAFIAGVTELIPLIGPIIGFVPALIVVLATDPEKWWWIVLFYIAVQQAENNLLVPRIQGQAVHLHPVVILILLAIGGALFGLLGVILVVPIAAAIRDVYLYVYRRLGDAADREASVSTGTEAVDPAPAPSETEPEAG